MRTYQTLFKNEKRAVELTIRDETGQLFTPSGGFMQVVDADENVIVAEQGVYTQTGQALTIIDTTVTENIGKYKIIWRIMYGGYTYYHATELTVVEL